MGRLPAEGLHRWRDVDGGVVFSGHDDEGTGRVIRAGGLVVGLDDVVVCKAWCGQDEGGVKRIGGKVGAIYRDGIGGSDLQAFVHHLLIFIGFQIDLGFVKVDGENVVGFHREVLRPARVGIGDGAFAVSLGTDQKLHPYPRA